eukprot:scaffold5770_cov112-Skeletonema_dohrnii-CCMP3373.AAC.3
MREDFAVLISRKWRQSCRSYIQTCRTLTDGCANCVEFVVACAGGQEGCIRDNKMVLMDLHTQVKAYMKGLGAMLTKQA